MNSLRRRSLPVGQAYSRRRLLPPQEVRVRCRLHLKSRLWFSPLRAVRSLTDPSNQRIRNPFLQAPSNNSQSSRRRKLLHKRQHQSRHNRLNNNNKKSHKNRAIHKGSNSRDSHPGLLVKKENPKLPVILSSQRANSLRKRLKCTLGPRSANSR
jgi:hypothetical protein